MLPLLSLVVLALSGLFSHPTQTALTFFVVLWGLNMIGSVEPLPGSIEGVIYTLAGPGAHLAIFAVLYGSTALATGWYMPYIISGIADGLPLAELFIGTPEVTVQMLVFSVLFMAWYRRFAAP